jgi:hypothetical protein
MAKQTGRCSKCGHSYAYHDDADGEIVCSQCVDNDRTAPCAPTTSSRPRDTGGSPRRAIGNLGVDRLSRSDVQ